MPLRQLAERIHLRGHAEGVNHQNGACARTDRPLHGRGIEIERERIDLRERGHDDFVALADA